ncbi:MAG: hypothetical protein J6U21_12570 [Bacteroidales bacterium]|nr:hypothetical protein [Bacteroidales bacterium]
MSLKEYMEGIAFELAKLHILHGAEFTQQLENITLRKEFVLVPGETDIYSAESETDDDFEALLNAARKAVERGYRVFILPNPKLIRTADVILERKGLFRMYDVKTIQGKTSVLNRLVESIGQTNHVLLNMNTQYNSRLLAFQIKRYFEVNPDAAEVLIFKGKQTFSVIRAYAKEKSFVTLFSKQYGK